MNAPTALPKPTQVSIITVGMNHLLHLKVYFHSIFVTAKPTIDFEIIYVDNCSIDGSVEFVRKHYPLVKILENKIIKGFAANNNYGVSNSKGKYILILNPDVVVLPNAIDCLYNYLILNDSVGIVVPKLLNEDLSVQLSVRKFLNLKILFHRLINMGKDVVDSKILQKYLLTNVDKDKTQPVDWALGAAMFLNRSWFDRLKGFDERYFLYVEDVDLCLRNWKLGKEVIYLPESKFIHTHQRKSNNGWNKTKVYHLMSICRFLLKHNIIFRAYKFVKS